MSNVKKKKPYLRQKSNSKILAIFNTQNVQFAPLLVEYCHKNGIGCYLEKTTPSGHRRYVVEGKSYEITAIKDFINKAYSEFCHYDKEINSYANAK